MDEVLLHKKKAENIILGINNFLKESQKQSVVLDKDRVIRLNKAHGKLSKAQGLLLDAIEKATVEINAKIAAEVVDSKVGGGGQTFKPGMQVVVKPGHSDYILAIILKYISGTGKYQVEDAEDDEANPGQRKKFFFPANQIIPIPKKPRKEFPPKTKVLAIFPNSSCFYTAVVVATPSMNKDPEMFGTYIVLFDDDNGMERSVIPLHVLEHPSTK